MDNAESGEEAFREGEPIMATRCRRCSGRASPTIALALAKPQALGLNVAAGPTPQAGSQLKSPVKRPPTIPISYASRSPNASDRTPEPMVSQRLIWADRRRGTP